VANWLKAIFLLYTFAMGCFFASSGTLQQAFGVEFLSHGLSLIFLALLGFGLLYPLKFGVDRHNRFVLAFVFCMETVIFAEMINYGLVLLSYTYPVFDKALQLDCLRNTPELFAAEECNAFYDHDRTAGFRLVWEYFFSKSHNKLMLQQLAVIQGGLCCGFFSPFSCRANMDKFPSDRNTVGIQNQFLKQRVSCSTYDNYYPEQYNCADVYDYSTVPPTIGGCRFDLGVSFCLDNEITSDSLGCASYMEDYVVSLVAPHAPMFLGLSVFSFLYMLICCCMWWKRKETDVFPDFLNMNKELSDEEKAKIAMLKKEKESEEKKKSAEEDDPVKAAARLKKLVADPYKMLNIKDVEYNEIPDLFVVVPRARILVDEGFVEPDAHDLELGSVGIHTGRKSSISTHEERKRAYDDSSSSESGSGGSGSNDNDDDDKSSGSGSQGSDDNSNGSAENEGSEDS
jgi:hypothetical protein